MATLRELYQDRVVVHVDDQPEILREIKRHSRTPGLGVRTDANHNRFVAEQQINFAHLGERAAYIVATFHPYNRALFKIEADRQRQAT